jgi:hypothetical protein
MSLGHSGLFKSILQTSFSPIAATYLLPPQLGFMDGESLIASSPPPRALAPPSEDAHEVFGGPSSTYRHSEAASNGEMEEEETADAAGMVAAHDEPISALETPKQLPGVLPPSDPPSQSNAGLALSADTSLQPEVSDHNRFWHPETLHPRPRQ